MIAVQYPLMSLIPHIPTKTKIKTKPFTWTNVHHIYLYMSVHLLNVISNLIGTQSGVDKTEGKSPITFDIVHKSAQEFLVTFVLLPSRNVTSGIAPFFYFSSGKML